MYNRKNKYNLNQRVLLTKVQKIILFFLLLLAILFFLFNVNGKQKVTKVEPIKIEPLNIEPKNAPQEEPKVVSSEHILAQLKKAVKTSKENLIHTKENEHNKIITNLQHTIKQQEINKGILEKKASLPPRVIPKEVVAKEVVAKNVISEKIKPKKTITEKVAVKKAVTPKVVTKKIIVQKKPQISKKALPSTNEMKNLKQVKAINETKTKKAFIQVVQREPFQTKSTTELSREEEVSKYKSQYANSLEVVNVSETFEIEEPESHLSDAHYFEPIESVNESDNNAPLKFVKKLGVVEVSNQYETNFSISEKVELAKEGIVSISSASVETKELKNLDFVDTLEVVEVSEDFETTEAKSYLGE